MNSQIYLNHLYNALKAYKKTFIILFIIIFLSILLVTDITYTGDVKLYQCYGLALIKGSYYLKSVSNNLPYCQLVFSHKNFLKFHFLPYEYPILSIIFFLLPLIVPFYFYKIAYGLIMSLIAFFIFWLLRKYGTKNSHIAFIFYLLLGQYYSLITSFDAVPSLFVLISLILATKKRFYFAYFTLAISVFLKLYPLILYFPILIAEQQSILKSNPNIRKLFGSGIFILTCIFFTFLSTFIKSESLQSVFYYYYNRPVTYDSFPGSALWIIHFLGYSLSVVKDYGSENLVANSLNGNTLLPKIIWLIPVIFTSIFLLLFIFILIKQAKQKISLPNTFIILLLILMLSAKVLSIQYLLWLTPLIAYVFGLQLKWFFIWGGIVLCTFIYYPTMYTWVSLSGNNFSSLLILTLFIRNFLLLFFAIEFLKNKLTLN